MKPINILTLREKIVSLGTGGTWKYEICNDLHSMSLRQLPCRSEWWHMGCYRHLKLALCSEQVADPCTFLYHMFCTVFHTEEYDYIVYMQSGPEVFTHSCIRQALIPLKFDIYWNIHLLWPYPPPHTLSQRWVIWRSWWTFRHEVGRNQQNIWMCSKTSDPVVGSIFIVFI